MRIHVDGRASLGLFGRVLAYLSVPLLIPLLVGLYYGRDAWVFAVTAVFVAILGYTLSRLDTDPDLGAREGFLLVGITWLGVGVVGALPYLLAGGGIPLTPTVDSASTLANPVNALFESMSGFTTTGATVMGEISFERHSRALLIWRQLTQWLGGMGIVVLAVAILPELSVGGAQLMDAEAPGPGIEKLTPRIAETARVLWLVYLGFTILEVSLLYSLHLLEMAPEMTLYNAVAHGLTTLPTGGFSPEARSIEAFSAIVQWVIVPFMVVAGTNFALFYYLLHGEPGQIFKNDEYRFYLGLLATVTAVLASIVFTGAGGDLVGQIEPSIRHAVFQTVSIVTTTGYASIDFNTWGAPAKYLLLFGMFIGGSAGSTGGSIKIVRWLVILKTVRRELFSTVHPAAVRPVRIGGHAIDERAIHGIHAFTLLYLGLFFVATILVAVDVTRVGLEVSVLELLSAVAATLGNVGPGFEMLGPMNSYLDFPWTTKLFLVFLMWVGRLEIIPVLVLLTPTYWRS